MPGRLISDVIAGRAMPAAKPNATVLEAVKIMKADVSSAVVVVERGRLLGICTERDVVFGVVAEGLDPRHTRLADVMTPDPQTIGPDRPLAHALHLMYEGRFRHVPVVDARGHPIGLVCASDALDADCLELEKDLVRREEIAAIL